MAVDKNKVIAEATKLIQKGQFEKAIRAYEKLLAEDPKDVRVLLKVGELQQKKGDGAAAARTFGRVADAYGEQGFFLKAVAVYKQMLKLAPDDVSVNERLAALYQQLGILSDAMGQLQVVAAAAERSGDEPRLLDVLRRMVELDPENVGSAVRLGELYARRSQTKPALEQLRRGADALKRANRTDEYVRVAERIAHLAPDDLVLMRELAHIYLAKRDTKHALAKLQACFKADRKDVDTLTLLAQAFKDLGQVSKTVSVYKELAHVYAERGRPDDARATWRHVLELAPDDADAARAMGRDVPRPPPAPPAPPAPPPPRAPEPSRLAPVTEARTAAAPAGVGAREPAASAWPAGVHAQPIPNVQAPPRPPPAAQPIAAPARPPAPAPDRSASPGTIPKLLTETDVYLKYGLHEKALEHLAKVFAIDPDYLDAREKALQLRALRNERAEAAEEAVRVARIAAARGFPDRAQAAVARLRELAPEHPELLALDGAADRAVEDGEEVVVESADELVLEVEPPEAEGDEVAISAAAVEPPEEVIDEPGEVAAAVPEEALEEPVEELEPIEVEEFEAVEPEPLASEEVAPEAAQPEGVGDVASAGAQPPAEPVDPEQLEPIQAAPQPEELAEPGPVEEEEEDLSDELAEVESLVAEDRLAEARQELENLLTFYPDHRKVRAVLNDLDGRASPEAVAQPAPEEAVAPPAPAAEGTFDIATELAKELEEAPVEAAAELDPFQYSVEDVFSQFKKGVAQTVRAEDSDTHYDLGIAYKEMGLLDDALQEFEVALAGGGARREVDCLTMIAVCRTEKGDLSGAVQAYQRALGSPRMTNEASRAIRYELAAAYAQAGDAPSALRYLNEVLAVDPGYRDARALAEKLGGSVAGQAGVPPRAGGIGAPDPGRAGPKKNAGYA